MKTKITWILFILVGQVFGQVQDTTQLKIGTAYSIESKILNEERSYIVALPKSYNQSSTNYPVLVLSDGDYRFLHTSGIVKFLSNQNKIPEIILVAIPNTNRNRDLTPTHISANSMGGGGAENFMKFIEDELLPEIDKKYRTNKYRVLAGHSLGGLFAGYGYITNSSFNASIATDPSFWWDNQYVINKINADVIQQIKNKRLYISSAGNYGSDIESIAFMCNAHDLFYAKLKRLGVPYTNLKLQYFENENHGTSAYMSMYHGLVFVFENFNLEGLYSKSADEIIAHYNQLSKIIGTQFLPQDQLMRYVAGFKLYGGNDKDGAVKLLLMNIKNYPTSINYENLGSAYQAINNKKKALKNYKMALEFETPNKEDLKEKINAQEGTAIYLNTVNHTIKSEILKEERTYIVSLPPSYDSTKNDYPVMLILDGKHHVHYVSTTIDVMSKEGQMPEMIVVAVNTGKNRTRDLSPTKSLIGYNGQDNSEGLGMSGGGKLFFKFIKQEILPEVKKNYRTKDYFMFVGHSLGGLMVAEAYLNNSFFNSYIAIDPSFWWDNDYIIKKIDSTLIKNIEHKKFYFSGVNSYENTNGMIANMRDSHKLFIATLKNLGISHSNIKFDIFEDENHGSTPLISLYHGLTFIFKDYPLTKQLKK